MDGEDVSVDGGGVVVQGSAGDDEDGRVDKEGKGKQGKGELGNGVLERVLDGCVRGDVVDFVGVYTVGDGRVGRDRFGREKTALFVVGTETRLDDARAEEETVWHDGCTEDAAGLVEAGSVSVPRSPRTRR